MVRRWLMRSMGVLIAGAGAGRELLPQSAVQSAETTTVVTRFDTVAAGALLRVQLQTRSRSAAPLLVTLVRHGSADTLWVRPHDSRETAYILTPREVRTLTLYAGRGPRRGIGRGALLGAGVGAMVGAVVGALSGGRNTGSISGRPESAAFLGIAFSIPGALWGGLRGAGRREQWLPVQVPWSAAAPDSSS